MSSATQAHHQPTTKPTTFPGRPARLKRIPPPVIEDQFHLTSQAIGPKTATSSGGASHNEAAGVSGGSKAPKEIAARTGAGEASQPVLEGRALPPSPATRTGSAPYSGATRRLQNSVGGFESDGKADTRTDERMAKGKASAGTRTGGQTSKAAVDGRPAISEMRNEATGGAKERTRRVTCEEILSRYCDRFGFELARVTRSGVTGKGKRGVDVKIAGRLVGIGKGETTFEAIVDGYEDTVRYLFREDKMLRKELVNKGEVVAWKVAGKSGDAQKNGA